MPSLRLLFRSRPGIPLDVAAMCASVQSVFDANGLDVRVQAGASGHLALPGMSAVSVGSCVEVLAPDHRALFNAVAPTIAPHGEAAIFIVGTITDGGAASGCAAHPAGCPGLVMTEAAAAAAANGGTAADGLWVLAHEIGHLLGLQHVGPADSLMHDPPTAITKDPPTVSDDEKTTALAAGLLAPAAFAGLAAVTPPRKTVRVAPQAKGRAVPRKKAGIAARRKVKAKPRKKQPKARKTKSRAARKRTTRRVSAKRGGR
jgi:hypothetical protein